MSIKEILKKLSPSARFLIIAAALALGVGLLLLGGKGESGKNDEFDSVSLEEYEKELEKKITELCSRVDGVTNVTVAVSLSGGFEYVYATDSSGKPVTVGSGGSASGIIIKKKVPEIAGIGIVCRGGGNEAVRNRLVSLVSAACGIGANRVFVTEAKK